MEPPESHATFWIMSMFQPILHLRRLVKNLTLALQARRQHGTLALPSHEAPAVHLHSPLPPPGCVGTEEHVNLERPAPVGLVYLATLDLAKAGRHGSLAEEVQRI